MFIEVTCADTKYCINAYSITTVKQSEQGKAIIYLNDNEGWILTCEQSYRWVVEQLMVLTRR